MESDTTGTGYALSFDEFLLLVRNASAEDAITTFLKQHFGIFTEETDLRAVYQKIQDDPDLQFQFYQLAMSILR